MAVRTIPHYIWTFPAVAGSLAALAALATSMRYVGSPLGRDPRLDLLRGFCVFAMIVDHIGGAAEDRHVRGQTRSDRIRRSAKLIFEGDIGGLGARRSGFGARCSLGAPGCARNSFESAAQCADLYAELALRLVAA